MKEEERYGKSDAGGDKKRYQVKIEINKARQDRRKR